MNRAGYFLAGALLGGWLTYLWFNPLDPYTHVQDGDSCGDGRRWAITGSVRRCIPE